EPQPARERTTRQATVRVMWTCRSKPRTAPKLHNLRGWPRCLWPVGITGGARSPPARTCGLAFQSARATGLHRGGSEAALGAGVGVEAGAGGRDLRGALGLHAHLEGLAGGAGGAALFATAAFGTKLGGTGRVEARDELLIHARIASLGAVGRVA